MESIVYNKSVKLEKFADVLVVGGGPSGVAAAVSAAVAAGNSSARVVLIEQSGTFGGMSTLAGVPELMNFDDGRNFLSLGFGERVYSALYGDCAYKREWKMVRPEALKRLYDNMVKDAGVEFCFYSKVVDVVMSDSRVKYVVISSPEGLWALEVGCVVDCTGSGAVAVMAGAEYDFGDENGVTMPTTLCSLWGGVDFSRKGRDADNIFKALDDGVFSNYDTCLPGIKPTYPEVGVGAANAGHVFAVNDCDSRSLTEAMVEGRRILEEFKKYYKNYVPGCEGAVLLDSANYLGIRESRRIRCEKTLSAAAFYDMTVHDDEIGRYSYPIDIHPMTPDKSGMAQFDADVSKKHKDGESYGIPYGALVARGVDNVLVAGRSIGADRAMQASARVIPCCYITGQAAGVAAFLATRSKLPARELDVALLRNKISELTGK